MPMEHTRAVEELLAERYLQKEMSAAEAEEFETHYFECTECAAAVEAGEILLANGQAVSAERQARAAGSNWWDALKQWWNTPALLVPVAASLLLAVLAVYQGAVVIPGLRAMAGAARILPAFQLVAASRGEPAQITVPAGSPAITLAGDIPPDANFAQYLCELTGPGGVVFALRTPAPQPGQPITILVPAGDLRAGPFRLTVYGAGTDGVKRDKVSTFSFDIRFGQ